VTVDFAHTLTYINGDDDWSSVIPAVLVSILNHLIMGASGSTPAEPLLLGVGDSDGTGDGIMIDGDVEALAHEYCQRGVPVTFTVYPGPPDSDAAGPFGRRHWSSSRRQFNGAAPNGCTSIGQSNSLVPLPQPAS
jgi:hypothetical protein